MVEKKHKAGKKEFDEAAGEVGMGHPSKDGKTIESLQKDVEDLTQRSAEYFDGWQRERADFSNYKKRIERDAQLSVQDTTGRIAKKYLPVLDDLERALNHRPASGEGFAWSEGIELIYKKVQAILESEGITEIVAEGEQFDPTRHEALSQEPSSAHESGQIIEVIQKGYLIGDRILRPSLVRVAQ
jgi:molecular chaperone GrpE